MTHATAGRSLESYSWEEVRALLITLELPQYLPLVDSMGITGKLLHACKNVDDLKELGISVDDADDLLSAIMKIRCNYHLMI